MDIIYFDQTFNQIRPKTVLDQNRSIIYLKRMQFEKTQFQAYLKKIKFDA